jgi:lipoate-protein ligase B
MAYAEAYQLQTQLVAQRRQGALARDVFLAVEHQPVFTLGRRGVRSHLLRDEGFLQAQGIDLAQIERGGEITYHGPGQLVVYAILDLRRAGFSVVSHVERLEAVMVGLASGFGVKAGRDGRNRGVWVDGRKLGSVGIAIRHGVCFHGLALNVENDLTPFDWVNPCGLAGVRMTSLTLERGQPCPMAAVKTRLADCLATVFGRPILPISARALPV